MGFSFGIVGLPNVGKSSLFNALTGACAPSSNYPFCTIEPNKGMVAVPDEGLERLSKVVKSPKVTPAVLELVDVAGLVEGAHKGEGLGNKFLAHIRELDSLCHLVRLFRDPDVAREEELDPVKDLQVVLDELRFKDLETLESRIEKERKRAKATKETDTLDVLEALQQKVTAEKYLTPSKLSEKEIQVASELFLLTTKPSFVVANVDEEYASEPEKDSLYLQLSQFTEAFGVPLIAISAKIEEELANLEPEERREFMKEYGLKETGLERIIKTGYELLDLITFYTFNERELRAWTLKRGEDVVKAAGKIHTDMAKGFIKAEVINLEEFLQLGSFAKAREKGRVTTAGRDYLVRDRDIILVRFKV